MCVCGGGANWSTVCVFVGGLHFQCAGGPFVSLTPAPLKSGHESGISHKTVVLEQIHFSWV